VPDRGTRREALGRPRGPVASRYPRGHRHMTGTFARKREEERRMAKGIGRQDMTTLEEVVLGQALELEALMNVLEKKGLLSKAEVLEEMKRLRQSAPKAK